MPFPGLLNGGGGGDLGSEPCNRNCRAGGRGAGQLIIYESSGNERKGPFSAFFARTNLRPKPLFRQLQLFLAEIKIETEGHVRPYEPLLHYTIGTRHVS